VWIQLLAAAVAAEPAVAGDEAEDEI